MLEFLLSAYGIGAVVTAAICVEAVVKDDDLSTFEKSVYPIFGGLLWPYTLYVWMRGR